MPDRVTMTVTNDGACIVSPRNIGRSGELGIGMTVNVDATLATYGTGKYTYIQFITPDGQSFYKGDYDCSSGTFDVVMGDSDIMLLIDGDVEIQLVISDTLLENLPVIPNVALTGNAVVGDVALGKTFYSTDPLTKKTGTSVAIDTTIKNLLTENQSNIETNTVGFNELRAIITKDTSEHYEGIASLKVVTLNGIEYEEEGVSLSGNITQPNEYYTFSFYIKGNGLLFIMITDNVGEIVTLPFSCTDEWTRQSITIILAQDSFTAGIFTQESQAATFYIDKVQLEQGELATAWQIGQNGLPVKAETILAGSIGFVNGVKIVGTLVVD